MKTKEIVEIIEIIESGIKAIKKDDWLKFQQIVKRSLA